jgi:pantoate--beta-alanine ligase
MLNLNKKPFFLQAGKTAADDKTPRVMQTVAALREYVKAKKSAGLRIALVPTMGALHEGHLELVRRGREKADIVIASIFVNPTQFGPAEDFAAYPRTWDSDLEKLAGIGAHAVFHPSAQEMYPFGFTTTVSVKGVTETLEGLIRPGHFDGVATVVAKLLLQAQPDVALFGEKDFQQLAVIRQLVADLDIPVQIAGIPIVRDENGLALSSRNAYLTPEQRLIAAALNKTLFTMVRKISEGKSFAEAIGWGKNALLAAGFDSIDYLDIRDARTLEPASGRTGIPLRLLAAARIGKTRLIDNVSV